MGDKITVARWFHPDLHSFYDHPYIYFEVLRSVKHPPVIKPASASSFPDISRLNLSICKIKIAEGLKSSHRIPPETNPTKDNIATLITGLSGVILVSARNSKLPRAETAQTSARKMPRWSQELNSLRHKTKQAFKLWALSKAVASRSTYVELKATYQRNLRREKRAAWDNFRSSTI